MRIVGTALFNLLVIGLAIVCAIPGLPLGKVADIILGYNAGDKVFDFFMKPVGLLFDLADKISPRMKI